MKLNLASISFGIVLCFPGVSEALSEARENRGASCTANCTKSGEEVVKDLEIAGFGKDQIDITTNYNKLLQKVGLVNSLCSKQSHEIGSLMWCEENCMKKGGLKSRFGNRLKKVKDFISQRKKHCSDTMTLYGEVFQNVIDYDQSQEILKMKPNARKVMERKTDN